MREPPKPAGFVILVHDQVFDRQSTSYRQRSRLLNRVFSFAQISEGTRPKIVLIADQSISGFGDRVRVYFRLHRESIMASKEHLRLALRFVAEPGTQHFVNAPPILSASSHRFDYICGTCGTVLMHAEEGQVHNLLIRCTECGGFNSTDWWAV
jgi:DNA-directed RNA polymerase subunit RPC12/RpoP